MKKRAILFLFLLSIFLISFASAEVKVLGTFKTNECVTLKQTCANCTFVNLSVSIPPNQTTFLVNVSMSRITTSLFTFPFCNTSINGEYIYDTIGNPDGILVVEPISFIINPLGKTLTNSQAILYFLIFIFAFIIFLICMTFGIYLPSHNTSDQMTGYILAVNNLKYVKYLLFAVSYLLLMLMFFFGWMVSFGYLDLPFLGNLFNFGFYFLVIFLFVMFPILIYLLIANWVRDSKISEMLQRGLTVRG